jgi:hypothetical protein
MGSFFILLALFLSFECEIHHINLKAGQVPGCIQSQEEK